VSQPILVASEAPEGAWVVRNAELLVDPHAVVAVEDLVGVGVELHRHQHPPLGDVSTQGRLHRRTERRHHLITRPGHRPVRSQPR
jgi:hypothetical protein